jgi:hypothetical protein
VLAPDTTKEDELTIRGCAVPRSRIKDGEKLVDLRTLHRVMILLTLAMVSSARIECMAALALLSVHPAIASSDEEKTFSIISEPPGARVILNGRDRGTTPLEKRAGHWAFDIQKSTVFSKHLSEPWTLEISKDGYRTESIEITRSPFSWQA